MRKILTIPAYIWAFACILLIPVTFIKNEAIARQLARFSFMKIHPRYSGGYINQSKIVNGMSITVYKPVFNGISGKGSHGFVQVRFSGISSLPASIHQAIDYNFDNSPDFEITINTINGNSELKSLNPHVKSLSVSSKVKEDWLIRVKIDERKKTEN